MVAKSLLVFVGIGMASGLAMGMYLAEIKESGIMQAVRTADGPSISIVPAKPTFETGENITFRIINTGTVPLHSEDRKGVFGATITGLSGIVIYAFGANDIVQTRQNPEQLQEKQEHARINQSEHASATISPQSQDYKEQEYHTDGRYSAGHIPVNQQFNNSASTNDTSAAHSASYGYLLPGGEITLSWNQTRHDGESTQKGLYKISVYAETMIFAENIRTDVIKSDYDAAAAIAVSDDAINSETEIETIPISRSATVIIQ